MKIKIDYIDNLFKLSKDLLIFDSVKNRIELIKRFDNALALGEIPQENLTTLVFKETELTEIMNYLIMTKDEKILKLLNSLEELDLQLSYFRQYLQEKYGYWATITTPFLESIIKNIKFNSCLELMAGNAYISSYLKTKGKSVIATDNKSWSNDGETGVRPYTNIEKIDALTALQKYQNVDLIILAWSPNFDEVDFKILEQYRALSTTTKFLLIGEKNGATNSKKFWNSVKFIDEDLSIDINKQYSHYDIVHDAAFLIE